ncbi:MAG: hypothetical protein JW741_09570 [Sedimentisphaerales bacterium]|nr:hypothetical protein [Sedimentisphaerales bacterium]
MKSVAAVEIRREQLGNSALRVLALAVLLCLVVLFAGCSWQQPGETVAESHRRHQRVIRLNSQTMMSDVDRVLQLDQPSKLSDLRVP